MIRRRSTTRLLALAVKIATLLFFVAIPISCYHIYTWKETGEHVAKVSWLPDEASDITFYHSHTYTVEEFSIPERAFFEWVKGRDWQVVPIEGEVVVPRYYGLVTRPPREPGASASREEFRRFDQAYDEWLRNAGAVVKHGYTAGHRQRNGGGFIVAYDKDTGRAYYQSNLR